jgi:methyl-accepting chemotaxis protein
VVAEEVGKLAANSATSTQEIAQLVQQAVQDANRAVATVREVAADMECIESGSVEADGMMQRISAALEQQSKAVQDINANVNNLNQIGQSNAAASEQITATVLELAKIADSTRREVERFTV